MFANPRGPEMHTVVADEVFEPLPADRPAPQDNQGGRPEEMAAHQRMLERLGRRLRLDATPSETVD